MKPFNRLKRVCLDIHFNLHFFLFWYKLNTTNITLMICNDNESKPILTPIVQMITAPKIDEQNGVKALMV